ncbi:MAG: hypothetical protein RL274_1606 [Pseudomonadota bacterium]|jgi:hypothetical protein
MTTTTVLSEDTATIVRDDASRFEWGAVVAGAILATAITFFLVSVGAGLGLSLSSARNPTASGIKTFFTLGAAYFLAAQAFGAAVGGYVAGRMMRAAVESEEEHFRADAHGLAVWGLAVLFGLGLLALAAAPGLAAGATGASAAQPASYWADKLFRPAGSPQASLAWRQFAQVEAPSGNDAMAQDQPVIAEQAPISPSGVGPEATMTMVAAAPLPVSRSYADIKDEATRLLTAQAVEATANSADKAELVRLVSLANGMSASTATSRVDTVIGHMRTKAQQAADTARKAASYISIWTALALLFSAVVCVAATVAARWSNDDDKLFARRKLA